MPIYPYAPLDREHAALFHVQARTIRPGQNEGLEQRWQRRASYEEVMRRLGEIAHGHTDPIIIFDGVTPYQSTVYDQQREDYLASRTAPNKHIAHLAGERLQASNEALMRAIQDEQLINAVQQPQKPTSDQV